MMWKKKDKDSDKNRPFDLYRPCACGCDERTGFKGAGYLSGSDSQGNGFTIWIKTEKEYKLIKRLLTKRLIR